MHKCCRTNKRKNNSRGDKRMIAQFPNFYPDELVYSLLSRYYAKSGYLSYTYAAQDLFKNKLVRPDIEFLNDMTEDA